MTDFESVSLAPAGAGLQPVPPFLYNSKSPPVMDGLLLFRRPPKNNGHYQGKRLSRVQGCSCAARLVASANKARLPCGSLVPRSALLCRFTATASLRQPWQ